MWQSISSGVAKGVSSYLGARKKSKASKNAMGELVAGAKEATGLAQTALDRQNALMTPDWETGQAANNRLMTLLGIGGDTSSPDYGYGARDFSAKDFEQDPGYAFRLSEGLKGLDRQAAARGGLISGAALKAASRWNQEAGSQEYQNAFNRYQTNRANKFQFLPELKGAGMQAGQYMGGAAERFGQYAGENAMGAANARAGNFVNRADIYANMLADQAKAYSQAVGSMGSMGSMGKGGK